MYVTDKERAVLGAVVASAAQGDRIGPECIEHPVYAYTVGVLGMTDNGVNGVIGSLKAKELVRLGTYEGDPTIAILAAGFVVLQ